VRRQAVLVAQSGELALIRLLRLAADGGALEAQGVDPLAQHPHTPAFETAHFGVEVSLQRIVDRNQLNEMAPTQLSGQCPDNLCKQRKRNRVEVDCRN